MSDEKFLLDTNIFIQGHNSHYPSESFPGFWEWMDFHLKRRDFLSIDKVFEEIRVLKKKDRDSKKKDRGPVAEWAELRKHIFHKTHHLIDKEHEIQRIAAKMARDKEGVYHENHVHNFMKGADPRLILFAKEKTLKIVTMEVKVGPDSSKIKIPNVCEEYGVQWMSMIDWIKELKPKFNWDRPKP